MTKAELAAKKDIREKQELLLLRKFHRTIVVLCASGDLNDLINKGKLNKVFAAMDKLQKLP